MGGLVGELNENTFKVKFYPVMHLLTGPPGLTRNGGIWKEIKRNLVKVSPSSSFMVQAMHFTTYSLSQAAWEEWGFEYPEANRLEYELEKTFGKSRDIFLDSGGFQLLYSDKIDLSKWNLKISKEDIFRLQLKYKPNRLASLDNPISPNTLTDSVSKLQQISIDNAAWLIREVQEVTYSGKIYLAVHGRTPLEVRSYLTKLWKAIPKRLLNEENYGLALGSQVPLAPNPSLISENISEVLRWMHAKSPSSAPLHVFGVGDSVVGNTLRSVRVERELSFDNSTYAQSAFRMKVYDPALNSYSIWTPNHHPTCNCWACEKIKNLGYEATQKIMTAPSYNSRAIEGNETRRSDIMALFALHNLYWWRKRIEFAPLKLSKRKLINTQPISGNVKTYDYLFPLQGFKPRSRNLIVLSCTSGRPYSKSQTHRKVIKNLEKNGFIEGREYDRITLSGLFGPVHWKDETLPVIMNYDFSLSRTTAKEHLIGIRFALSNVLNVIRKKYDAMVGYLPPKMYLQTFGPIIKAFDGELVDNPEEIASKLVD
jgi:tRNA-guanine family transglycosylase